MSLVRTWARAPHWLIAVIILALLATGALASESIGHLTIDIHGRVTDIVLVDPKGRADRYDNNISTPGIPQCHRWPGGLPGNEDESTSADSLGLETTTFLLDFVEAGRYVLLARTDSTRNVTISIVFDRANGEPGSCNDLEKVYQVRRGARAWVLDVRKSVPRGECGVRLSRMPAPKLPIAK